MKTFSIFGNIVDTDVEKTSFEDTTPAQFQAFIKKLENKEPLEIILNSCGGSVTAGISIANQIKSLNNKGHKTTCIVDGLAASIATVIMCACQKIIINESSMIMIHNCWSVVQGDSNTLRKEADVMDVMNDAILSFYRSKFDLTDEQLKQYMNDELWFSGKEAANFGLKCEVIPDANDFAIAAKVKKFDLTKFNTPSILVGSNMENEEPKEIKKIEQPAVAEGIVIEKVTETVETKTETDTITKTPIVEEVKEVEETVGEESVPKAEVEKRVSGMQSTMAKKMDAMKKDYEAKIAEFTNQIKALNGELENAKAESIRVKDELEKSKKELSDMTSAFEEKTTALAHLNASVNTPCERINWKALKGKEFFDYVKNHPEINK